MTGFERALFETNASVEQRLFVVTKAVCLSHKASMASLGKSIREWSAPYGDIGLKSVELSNPLGANKPLTVTTAILVDARPGDDYEIRIGPMDVSEPNNPDDQPYSYDDDFISAAVLDAFVSYLKWHPHQRCIAAGEADLAA